MGKRIRKKKHLMKAIGLVSHLEEEQALILTGGNFLKVKVQTLTLPQVATVSQPIEVEGYLIEVIRK